MAGSLRIDVRGATLAYTDTGEGRPFVWGHGTTASRRKDDEAGVLDWTGMPFRLIRYDARNHGESSVTTDPAKNRFEELALDLLGLADALGLDRFASGGASMGCGSTLHAAVCAPGRIDAMVLAAPVSAWEGRIGRSALYAALPALDPSAVRAGLAQRPVPELFAERPEYIRTTPDIPDEVLADVLSGVGHSDLPPREQLRELTQPALVLAWDSDTIHPLATAVELAEVLPNAELVVADTLDDVRRWPRRIAEFLGSSPA